MNTILEIIDNIFSMILGLILLIGIAIILFAPFYFGPIVGLLWWVFLAVFIK